MPYVDGNDNNRSNRIALPIFLLDFVRDRPDDSRRGEKKRNRTSIRNVRNSTLDLNELFTCADGRYILANRRDYECC